MQLRLHKLNEPTFPFVTRIKFIRWKFLDFSAHVSRVSDWLSQGRIGKVHVPVRENIVPQIISAMTLECYTCRLNVANDSGRLG